MSKTETASKSATPPPQAGQQELPTLEAPQPKALVGLFNPQGLNFPSHEQMVGILAILGLQSRPFHGQDKQGNLVNVAGEVIIPAHLRSFFMQLEVQPDAPQQ